MHLTRKNMSNTWPIPRKGTKYIVVPSHAKKHGIPLVIIIRNILELVKTKKELKKILIEEKVTVNERIAKKENISLLLFDTLGLKTMKKFYRVTLSELGKFALEEISEKELNKKIVKVSNKKIVKGKKIQINLADGRNILSNENVSVGDSVIIDLKNNKIEKVIRLTDKSRVMIVQGKYAGKLGSVEKIDGINAIIKTKDKEIKIQKDKLIVLDK